MFQIFRIEKPSVEEFLEAFRVCEERWDYLKSLRKMERFQAFQKLGVELVIARDEYTIQAVCFVLPDVIRTEGRDLECVWLFQLASRREARNVGGLMLYRIMSWYPVILTIGVTEEARRIYEVLKWNHYDRVWRCVHPISVTGLLHQYKSRLQNGWKRGAMKMAGFVYDPAMNLMELILGCGVRVEKWLPLYSDEALVGDRSSARRGEILGLVSGYLDVHRVLLNGKALDVVETAGVGRVVRDQLHGFDRLRAHARMWRVLRGRDVRFTELPATSKEAASLAVVCGYFPLRMPIYFWDRSQRIQLWLMGLEKAEFGFASCDKIL